MKPALASLVRFYVLSTYGLKGGAASPGSPGADKGPGALRGKASFKGVAKVLGIALLALFVVADLSVLFFSSNYAMYSALKTVGLQDLLILNASVSATFIILLLGFVTSLSTYCLSGGEGLVLALPIKPRHLFTAKLVTSYLSEFLFAVLLMGSALGVYAWGEHPGPAFYLAGIVTTLALPLVPLAFNYLILVPLMSTARFLRNKNAVMILGGVLGLGFAMVFNFFVQGSASKMADPAWMVASYAGPTGALSKLGQVYPPALLAYQAIPRADLQGLGYSLLNLALGLGFAALVILILGPAYAKSLSSFGETRLKRLKAAKAFITKNISSSPPLWALLKREVRLMNREPVYLLNGPLIVLLMPVIVAVAVLAQAKDLGAISAGLASLGLAPSYTMLMAAGAGTFLGSSTSITATAVSRDAKALPWLKALPVSFADLGMAKFLHGFVFALFGSLVGSLGLGLVFGLPALAILGAFCIATALSSLITIGGLWLDTANPRLHWDSPTAALKQNPNSVIVILGAMALLAGLGVLAAYLPLGSLGFLLLYGLVPGLASAGALAAYPGYASKKLGSLEL